MKPSPRHVKAFVPELEDMIGNHALKEFLLHQSQRSIPEMLDFLITGPPGTGKTSSILSFHRRITGRDPADGSLSPEPYRAADGTCGRTWKMNGRSTCESDVEKIVEFSQNTTGHDIIFVDELGFLYENGRAESLRSALDSPKVLVIATSQDFSKLRRRNESESIATERLVAMMRRFQTIATDPPTEMEMLVWVIKAIKRWQLECENNDPDIVRRLIDKANGSVGWLMLLLEKAAGTPDRLLTLASVRELETDY